MSAARRKALVFYRTPNGQHQWRLKGGNGTKIATPGESFATLAGAEKNAGLALGVKVVRSAVGQAQVEGRDDIRVEYEA